MGMRGPTPQKDAIRRERPSDQATWTDLPATGRQGEPPPWPLTRPSARELDRWRIEWAKPQALMWERDGQAENVAHYVRTFVEAERRKVPVNLRSLLDSRARVLGLTVDGLLRLRWRIVDGAPASEGRPTGTEGPSARERFKVVNGGR